MTQTLAIRPASDCRWDIVALGEVMLRFDPGAGRVRTARQFTVWEGGGEYNVARGLRRCFGQRAALISALPDNELGRLAEDLILQGGVDTGKLIWREHDGIGRNTRLGLNFTERGFGLRAGLGCSDRGYSAASQIQPGEIDWDRLFGKEGVRWFHTGGIFAALAPNTAQVAIEAVEAARRHGTIVSFDFNYRPSLWKNQGDDDAVRRINRRIAGSVDVLIANDADFIDRLGVVVDHANGKSDGVTQAALFEAVIAPALAEFPNLAVIATTLRNPRTATSNDWSAMVYADGRCHRARAWEALEIHDRIGGGDGFAAGLIYGLLRGLGPAVAVDYGAAHAALVMTTPGDNSMARLEEVEAIVRGDEGGIIR